MGQNPAVSTLNYRQLALVLILAVLICVLGFLYVKNKSQVAMLLKQSKLVPVPESYTELYFTNHWLLPHAYKTGQKMFFEYTVRNLENKRMQYSPRVVAIDGSTIIPIAQQTFALDHNESITIPITFALDKEIERVKIEVQIPEKSQSIRFWLDYFRIKPPKK